MPILLPSYTEDREYPAYQDRLVLKSAFYQAGVINSPDLRVTAGTEKQVNIHSGNAVVEQTKALLGEFYNGVYQVPITAETTPSNSATIPSSHPQIAQIILRVYDINELKLAGNSSAKLEWLNGTENAGATKEKAEKALLVPSEAESVGAAALPESSLRLAYVVIPNGATSSSEYTIVDARQYATGRATRHIRLSGESTRENTAYGAMTPGDEVEIYLPVNSALFIRAFLEAKSGVSSAGTIALFAGTTQVGATVGITTSFVAYTTIYGLAKYETKESATAFETYIPSQLASGNYKISIQSKSTSSFVAFTNRYLWVESKSIGRGLNFE